MAALHATIDRSVIAKGAFGHNFKAVTSFIASIDPSLHHTYGRNAKAADAAWATVEPWINSRFRGTAQEAHDALKAAGKLTKQTYRAACAMIARDRIESETFDILFAPFVTLGSVAA